MAGAYGNALALQPPPPLSSRAAVSARARAAREGPKSRACSPLALGLQPARAERHARQVMAMATSGGTGRGGRKSKSSTGGSSSSSEDASEKEDDPVEKAVEAIAEEVAPAVNAAVSGQEAEGSASSAPIDPPEDQTSADAIPTSGAMQLSPEELKLVLIDSLIGTDRGLNMGSRLRGEILEYINMLEAQNPTMTPNESPELLSGRWRLRFTAASELTVLRLPQQIPGFKVKEIYQTIDVDNQMITNSITVTFQGWSQEVSSIASFRPVSDSRIEVEFTKSILNPPKFDSDMPLPTTVSAFGQVIDVSSFQAFAEPLRQFSTQISGFISEQGPFEVPVRSESGLGKSWLITTYLDSTFRIVRGDGGVFVLTKEEDMSSQEDKLSASSIDYED